MDCAPLGVWFTAVIAPVTRLRTYALLPFAEVKPGTRLVPSVMNAIKRPSLDRLGFQLRLLAVAPVEARLASVVAVMKGAAVTVTVTVRVIAERLPLSALLAKNKNCAP